MATKFVWVARIEIDETWVADGFDLTEERLHRMVQRDLLMAYDHEIKCKILKAPDPEEIRRAQGGK